MTALLLCSSEISGGGCALVYQEFTMAHHLVRLHIGGIKSDKICGMRGDKELRFTSEP